MGGPERRRTSSSALPTPLNSSVDNERCQLLNDAGAPQTIASGERSLTDHNDVALAEAWEVQAASPSHHRHRYGCENGSIAVRTSDRLANNNGGLYHRHVLSRSGSGDAVDEYERGYAGAGTNSQNNNALLPKYQSKVKRRATNTKRSPFGRWIRSCLLAGIPAYLVLIFLFLKHMNHQHSLQRRSATFTNQRHDIHNEDVAFIRETHTNAKLERSSRQLRDELEAIDSFTTQKIAQDFLSTRSEQARPLVLEDRVKMNVTVILSAADFERPNTTYIPDENPRLALMKQVKMDEICGAQAQSAARNSPGAFTYRDSLNVPKIRVTRVLITGLLTPTAYSLALALKEQCGVEVIIGFDAMYPNSIRNRLRLIEQMTLLTKHIPQIVRPVFVPHIGLDPMRHSKSFKTLSSTHEIDICSTLNPTHIIHFASHEPSSFLNSDPDWKNLQSPYVRTGDNPHNPSLYALRSGILSMEHILASIANAPSNDRPHLIYASVTTAPADQRRQPATRVLHNEARRIDELLADFYYQQYGVYSIGLRLPGTIYGPWGHPESDIYRIMSRVLVENSFNVTKGEETDLDLLHVDDAVMGVIAAMQYRSEGSKPMILELGAAGQASPQLLEHAVRQIMDPHISPDAMLLSNSIDNRYRSSTKKCLGWTQQVSLREGLIRTVAWHVDQASPFGPRKLHLTNASITQTETGDMILRRHSLRTCSPSDLVCHSGRPFLPCASECSTREQCLPTIFDGVVSMVQELTEECDVVLYTHNFNADATDLTLQSEFVENDHPLVCNFAFINEQSELVNTVIDKVPDSELGKLGLDLNVVDMHNSADLRMKKLAKLNGRLLYRGWILIWTRDSAEELPIYEKFFLKLSPGRLFHNDVKAAIFIDQQFGVSPKADDIKFLVHEMHRNAWHARVVKRKTRPKAKFLLPAEPQRQAALLMSVLKYQDSSAAERLSPDTKITIYEATRFMRHSNGEEPLGKELPAVKAQREFYERIRSTINLDHARWPGEPQHKFEMKHWVRSRWVAHDMTREESRQLRCAWYREHVLWETDLDQLSFAFTMEKLELDRKLAFGEPDESAQKQLAEKTEMKKLLSDTFEWYPLKTEETRHYSPYDEISVLPYDMDGAEDHVLIDSPSEDQHDESSEVPLFVRIVSDRIMAYARKSWSNPKETTVEEPFLKTAL